MKLKTFVLGITLSGIAIADEPFKNYLYCYDKLSDIKAELEGGDYVNWSRYKVGSRGLRAAVTGNDLKEKLVSIPGEKDNKKGIYLVHDQGVSFYPAAPGGIQNLEIEMPNHSKNPGLQIDASNLSQLKTKFSADELISPKKVTLNDSFSQEDVKIVQDDLRHKIEHLVSTFRTRHTEDNTLKSNSYLNALEDCKKGLNASDAEIISEINEAKDSIASIQTPRRRLIDRILPRTNQQ